MRRVTWYWWVALLASCSTTGALALGISLHSQAENNRRLDEQRRESDRRLCGVVVTMDDSYRETPARTPAGKNLQESISQLRRDLGCPI